MGVIDDVKRGWQRGRDLKHWREDDTAAGDEYRRTRDMLESELGEDDRRENERSAFSDRNWRIYEATHGQAWNKYPSLNENSPKGVGLIAEVIGENLPRKKKRARRKVVRKKPKRCRCK